MTTLQFNSEEAQRLLALYVTPEIVAERRHSLQVFIRAAGNGCSMSGPAPACWRPP